MRVVSGLALLLAVTAGVVSVIALLDDQGFKETTLSLTEKDDQFKANDVPPPSKGEEDISPGDSFTFTSDISGDRDGRLLGFCVATSEEFQPTCTATYTLDDGTIDVAGSPNFEETFEVAVVGGTGAYVGASGSATIPQESEQAPTEIELLIPDD